VQIIVVRVIVVRIIVVRIIVVRIIVVQINDQLRHLGLANMEIGLAFQDLAHFYPILLFVTLSAGGPHRGAARGIEQAKLDTYRVRDLSHDAAEGIDFADQVSFGDTTHGGVAGHLGDQVGIQSKQGGLETHAGGRHGGFAAGMAGSDHDYIELFTEWRHFGYFTGFRKRPFEARTRSHLLILPDRLFKTTGF